MPKNAQYTITWSEAEQIYHLQSENGQEGSLPQLWLQWLEEHRSFAFHGRNGHLTLLKEKRNRGTDGYWYAYQRHGQNMEKRYIGRSSQLMIEHLEEIASQMLPVLPGVPAQFEPLLMPKIQLPRLQKSLLPRNQLLKLLDQGLEYKLTLIAGPAGYGKTTLISQWLAAHNDLSRVSCLTLDEGDNDPIRFWRYFIAACQQFQPGFGKEALELLYAHRLPPFKPLESMLTVLLNEISLFTQRSILILDDFHLVNSSQVTETLAFLLDHLPTAFHLIILIRGDFPFSLARLRAHNELLDIHPPQLGFSLEETRTFFEQELSIQLAPKLLRQVFERIDGWPAGLRLLVAELHWPENTRDIEQALTAFAGSNWSVQDYFLTQIVPALPAEQQEFLLQTSILPLLNAELCDTITGRTDSARLLGNLRRGDHFLIPMNSSGIWARYHTLFAEAMQQEARRQLGEEAVRLLSVHASEWYEKHELLAEAIEVALSASAFTRTANLIEQFVGNSQQDNVLATSKLYTLRRWIESLPEDELECHPVLCLQYAMALLFICMEGPRLPKGHKRIDSLLQIAEQKWRDTNDLAHLAGVFAFRALLARQEGKFLQASTWARQSLAWLPQEDSTWRNLSLTVVGIGELLDGHLSKAHAFLLEALAISEQQQNLTYARATRGMIASVHFEQAELRQAHAQFRQIQLEARAQEDLDDIAHTQLGLAQIAYHWNNLDEAEQAAQEALRINEQLRSEEFQVLATLRLALIEHAHQQSQQAQQRLTAWLAQNQTPVTAYSYQLSCEVQATLARIYLDTHNLALVERWVADRERGREKLPRLQYQREQLLLARLLLAQKALSEALKLLESLYMSVLETGHVFLQLEIQIVMVIAYSQQGASAKTRQHLHTLLVSTQSEGYMRLFLNEGEELASILRSFLPHEKGLLTYARHILSLSTQTTGPTDAIASNTEAVLSEPLSAQEQKVLRLLAAGNSNAEIANELVVSVNTVRTQLQSIYRKLNVNNRSAASKLAKQLAL